ncbi:MAG TPA: 2-phospho-L-lactate guanylyltransferase [Microthrixaceae bacterium]|jgi:2-phospho-L-lactate guanylyltransferase|nr:2-phospho-L-lactate guanylyltransferase [Microthrixaceae bacterium]
MTDSAAPPPRAVVLVPVKSFSDAKVRLAGVLDERSRAELARSMATRVLHAAAPLPVAVVCDDDDVAKWAIDNGASAIHTDRVGLNPAVAFGVSFLAADDVERVIVAHADLPFATGLAALGDAAVDEVVLVPDRRGDGTNVASIPTGRNFTFHYGPGSFRAHCDEARRLGLTVRVLESTVLGWDVDEPDDLYAPAALGTIPGAGSPDEQRANPT